MLTTALPLHDLVKASRLGHDLTPEQVVILAGLVTCEQFKANQMLAREGDADNHLYVIVDGAVGVVKHHGTPDETLIVTLGPDDFVHELGFLDGQKRYASLVALRDTRVLVLEREQLERLIDSHPQILYRVMCTIVRTVHSIQNRLAMQASELTNYIFKQHGRY